MTFSLRSWSRRVVYGAVGAVGLATMVGGQAQAVSPPSVRGENGMVASAQTLASQVGANVLKDGGNAADAAVAIAYALAVVYPCCGNLGGGGFALVRTADGVETFIDFREKAPAAATSDMFLDDNGDVIADSSLYGYKAVGIPGTVLGLHTLLSRYGTMDRQALMEPAIRLAEKGFILRQADVDYIAIVADRLAKDANTAEIFLNDAGEPWPAGHRLIQADLAKTLKLIAENGPDAFYKGSIAEAVVQASSKNGGVLTIEDFEDYNVTIGKPVVCHYRGYGIHSAPPPSSGGTTLCEILNIVEAYPLDELGFNSAATVHLLVEAMRLAYVDRNFLLGDPAFVDNPVDILISEAYAAEQRTKIQPQKAGTSTGLRPGLPAVKPTETTHLSIVDRDGNAVALTFTLNFFFGSGLIAGDTGFLLNDDMDDFTIKPGTPTAEGLVQGENNAIAPGKRPLSSMSPTIVTKDGEVFMVLGSPGGPRIITNVAQAIMNVVDHGMNLSEAVFAPRIHHQWMPDVIFAEYFALSADTRERLEAMGYTIVEQRPWGAVQAVMIASPDLNESTDAAFVQDTMVFSQPTEGTRLGVSDGRRPTGSAVGH